MRGRIFLVALVACRPSPPAPRTTSADASTTAQLDAAPVVDLCRIAGARIPSLVRWTPAERDALERAMQSGVAVLAADDCRGARLLPACHASGHYGYIGQKVASYAYDLSTDEELRVNAPLSGAPSTVDAGAPLHVSYVVAGVRATTRGALEPKELTGDCAGATHFVTAADIGAVSSGACSDAHPDDAAPPATCKTIVEIRTSPIAELDDLTTFDHAPSDAVLNIGVCPDTMVVTRSHCAKPPVTTPYLCAFGNSTECRAQCEGGDMNSCDVLAFMSMHGKGVTEDHASAASLYDKSCAKDDAIACVNMGGLRYRGDGVPQDRAKAATFFARACTLGSADACGDLANAYFTGDGMARDLARGEKLLRHACEAGSARNCSELALRLRTGDGVAKDVPRALAMYGDSCAENDGIACTELGRLHMVGQDVPMDHAAAVPMFDHACRSGFDRACVMSALLYRQADGVARDDVRATRLLQRACSRGDGDGCHNLGIAYEKGKGIAPDSRRAAELYDRACNASVAQSCLHLGDFAHDGVGVEKNASRAKELYTRACTLGAAEGCAKAR